MADPTVILRQRFSQALAAAFGSDHAGTDPLLRPSGNPRFGDYQANLAMSLGKTLGQKPRAVAELLVAQLDWRGVCSEKPTVAGPGFINLKLAPEFLAEQLAAMASSARLGVEPASPRDHVVVDYSGPNVAKEMHVGHLRSTVIGDALARVLEFLGHRVTRQNHLGDWGTQFGMLIEHLMDRERDHAADAADAADSSPADTIADLNAFYQQAKKRFDADPAFADRARKRVVALQSGDPQTLARWRTLIEESKRHFQLAYGRMGVKLGDADIRAESFYNDKLPAVVDELERLPDVDALGLRRCRPSDGALCVFLDGYLTEDGRPLPMIVRKSDGGYLYATTDLAALRFRAAPAPEGLGADRLVYVTDARQKQHFAMVFQTAAMAGWTARGDARVRLDHVPFGTVLGEDNKPFKTRSGDTVKLIDLLDEAEERALRLVTQKNPDLSEAERRLIAHAVGIGAIKYADLANDRIKDYVFSWDRMLSFDGNTAPYLQNAYVRIRSIFRKAGTAADPGSADPVGPIRITAEAERSLALKLLQFPGVIDSVADSLEPHRLCGYLYELASIYHHFYEHCPVLNAGDQPTRHSRLALCALTADTLRTGLDLLGIQVVEQM